MLLFCRVSCLDTAYRLKPRVTTKIAPDQKRHPLGGHIYDVSQINQVNNWLIIICNFSSP